MSAYHLAHRGEVDPVGWHVVVVADEDPLSRPGVLLAEVLFVANEATAPDSSSKGHVGVFAERPVVRRVPTDGLNRQAV